MTDSTVLLNGKGACDHHVGLTEFGPSDAALHLGPVGPHAAAASSLPRLYMAGRSRYIPPSTVQLANGQHKEFSFLSGKATALGNIIFCGMQHEYDSRCSRNDWFGQ